VYGQWSTLSACKKVRHILLKIVEENSKMETRLHIIPKAILEKMMIESR